MGKQLGYVWEKKEKERNEWMMCKLNTTTHHTMSQRFDAFALLCFCTVHRLIGQTPETPFGFFGAQYVFALAAKNQNGKNPHEISIYIF